MAEVEEEKAPDQGVEIADMSLGVETQRKSSFWRGWPFFCMLLPSFLPRSRPIGLNTMKNRVVAEIMICW